MTGRAVQATGELESESGLACYAIHGTKFLVPKRFKLIKLLGFGTLGYVCVALDEELGREVFLKKIPDVFADMIEAKRIIRQIVLLRTLTHPNLLTVTSVLEPPSNGPFEDVYLTSNPVDSSLQAVLRSQQPLLSEHVQHFSQQILLALRYIHACGVVHGSLRPACILVNADASIRVGDIASRFGTPATESDAFAFVASPGLHGGSVPSGCLPYAPLETLLSGPAAAAEDFSHEPVSSDTKGRPLGAAADMWAFGCVLAEMFVRRPIIPAMTSAEAARSVIVLSF